MAKTDKPYLRVGVKSTAAAPAWNTSSTTPTRPSTSTNWSKTRTCNILVKADAAAVSARLGARLRDGASCLPKFVFRNPNQTDACGCGESVTIEPAKLES